MLTLMLFLFCSDKSTHINRSGMDGVKMKKRYISGNLLNMIFPYFIHGERIVSSKSTFIMLL